jgi:hypothetical protein
VVSIKCKTMAKFSADVPRHERNETGTASCLLMKVVGSAGLEPATSCL